jgi:hypothetical protein
MDANQDLVQNIRVYSRLFAASFFPRATATARIRAVLGRE